MSKHCWIKPGDSGKGKSGKQVRVLTPGPQQGQVGTINEDRGNTVLVKFEGGVALPFPKTDLESVNSLCD